MAATTSVAIATFDLNQGVWKFPDKRLIGIPAVVTPTLDLAAMSRVRGDGLEFFTEQSLRQSQVRLLTTFFYTPSDTTLNINTPGETVIFAVGDVVQIIKDGVIQAEYMLVTGVDLDNDRVEVQRGHAGTSALAYSSGTLVLRRLYSSMKADVTVFTSTRVMWSTNSNYYQRIYRKRQITEEYEMLDTFEGTQFAHEVEVATSEVLEDLHRAVTIGYPLTSNPQGDPQNYPAMRGFHKAWTDSGLAAYGQIGGAGGGYYDDLMGFLASSYSKNKGHDTLIVGAEGMRKLFTDTEFVQALEPSGSCKCSGESTIGEGHGKHLYVGKLKTAFGTFKLMVNEYLAPIIDASTTSPIYAIEGAKDLSLVEKEPIEMKLLAKPDNGTAFRVGGIFSVRYTDMTLWERGNVFVSTP